MSGENMAKEKRIRPDFSDFVVHFTTNRKPCGDNSDQGDERNGLIKGDAYSCLENILKTGEVWATTMPWTNQKAVCFTECTWASLLDHANHYSPFGIGFSKAFLFACGGGPAIYLRADLYDKQKKAGGFESNLHSFITPFWPFYAPKPHRDRYYGGKSGIDYAHEREWRVPHDVKFTASKVAFVIVDKYEDMAKLPKAVKDAIGREKFLIMSNYRKVEEFWPTHLV